MTTITAVGGDPQHILRGSGGEAAQVPGVPGEVQPPARPRPAQCLRPPQVHNMADEFMIVAGMPQTIGEEHVTEVAAMALDILAACLVFQVPRVTTCHV